ncbi:Hpt domain-containing protein [Caldimonas tepidiphila]|uniref:hybrid sensor histidine kinase/response regulator n=1 Tax=Caldimonas tepidiphila TaxID=2315841 RepID=UPI001F0C70BA|nr:Hpt domain-containing protein [Caldimonas tepidiphila]
MDSNRDTPPHDDLSALAWVQEELRKSLEASNKALHRFLKEAESAGASDVDDVDPAILRGARQQLHQSAGALELVGLSAAAHLLRAVEAAVQRFVLKPHKLDRAAVEVLERAAFALMDYLARLLAGRKVSPVALFPQYSAVQKLAGAERVHPADLWSFDWRWIELPAEPGIAARAADAAARNEMERLLLTMMRQPAAVAVVAARMSELCAGLGAQAPTLQTRSFWRLAAAFFQGQALGLLPNDVYTKRVASRVLAQFGQLGRGESEVSDRLAQDLLFFCAQCVPSQSTPAPRVAAVRRAYGLEQAVPVSYEESHLGRFDPALLLQARKRVAAAKDSWSAVAGGEMHRLHSLNEQFSLVGDSLRRIYPGGEVLAEALQQAVVQTVNARGALSAPLAMEVATSVLYLEASLEDADFDDPAQVSRTTRLAERITAVRHGQKPEPLEAWMEDLYRRVSDRQTMGSVVQELRASLSDAEEHIDQFFRKPEDVAALVTVPAQLGAMRGVLSVLGLKHASQAVVRMRDDVDALISGGSGEPGPAREAMFHRLAGNLSALGFLIDMVSVQPNLAKSLFVFDEATGELRPLMGRAVEHPLPAASSGESQAPAAPAFVPQAAQRPEAPPALVAALAVAQQPAAALAAEAAGLPPVPDAPPVAAEGASAAVPTVPEPMRPASLPVGPRAEVPAPVAEKPAAAPAMPHPAVAPAVPAATPASAPAAPVAAAPATLPPAVNPAPLLPPALVDEEVDAEMREIFLEEAAEVLVQAGEGLDQLAAHRGDADQLTVVRRAFHTLKGSARMVGLKDFGEAGWACEQLYNLWLAEQRPASKDLLSLSREVLAYMSAWVQEIAAGTPPTHQSPPVRVAADALRLEGRVVPLASIAIPHAEVQPAAAEPVATVPEAPAVEESALEQPVLPAVIDAGPAEPVLAVPDVALPLPSEAGEGMQDVAAPAIPATEPVVELSFDGFELEASSAAEAAPAPLDLPEAAAQPATEPAPQASATVEDLAPSFDAPVFAPQAVESPEIPPASDAAADFPFDDFDLEIVAATEAVEAPLPEAATLLAPEPAPEAVGLAGEGMTPTVEPTEPPAVEPEAAVADSAVSGLPADLPFEGFELEVASVVATVEEPPAVEAASCVLPAAAEEGPVPAEQADAFDPADLASPVTGEAEAVELPALQAPFDAAFELPPLEAEQGEGATLPGEAAVEFVADLSSGTPAPAIATAEDAVDAARVAESADTSALTVEFSAPDFDLLFGTEPVAAPAAPQPSAQQDEAATLPAATAMDEAPAAFAQRTGDADESVIGATPDAVQPALPEPGEPAEATAVADLGALDFEFEIPAPGAEPPSHDAGRIDFDLDFGLAGAAADAAEFSTPAQGEPVPAESVLPPEFGVSDLAAAAETLLAGLATEPAQDALLPAEPQAVSAAADDQPAAQPAADLAEPAGDMPDAEAGAFAVEEELTSSDDLVKAIGPLRVATPLFNIYLAEADELSLRLCAELGEWAVEPTQQPSELAIAAAHSLAGCSATVGFSELSQLARQLEHALMRTQTIGFGLPQEALLFGDVAEEIRSLLHQFAAGFLGSPQPLLLERLAAHELDSAQRLGEANRNPAAADEPEIDPAAFEMEPLLGDEALLPAGVEPAAFAASGEDDTRSPAAPASEEAIRPEEPQALQEPAAMEAVAAPPADEADAAEPVLLLPESGEVAAPADEAAPVPQPAAASLREDSALVELMRSGVTSLETLEPLAPVTPRTESGVRRQDIDDDIDAVDAVDTDLFPIFEEEAEELLPKLAGEMREWLQQPGEHAVANACMRTLHTLKGGARLAGAMRLGELAHRLETSIERLMARGNIVSADVEALQAKVDALAATFEALRSMDAQAYADAAALLHESAQPAAPQPAAMPVVPAGSVATEIGAEAGAQALLPAVESLLPIDWSRFTPHSGLARAAVPRGTSGGQTLVRVRAQLLDRLVGEAGEVSITRARLEAELGSIRSSVVDLTDNLERLRQQLRDIELQAETQMATRMEAAKAEGHQFDPLEFDRFTRFQEITRMMAESVNDVHTVQRTLMRTLQTAEDELAAQARLTRDLQDDLLRTRMVEFEGMFERLYRVVRQAAKESGKQVRLDIVGGSIEVDRGVLERMTGPFEHLLRNAVTHGIESPEQRAAAGKDPIGTILISLQQEGNEVMVEFRDDGAGLNLQRIRDKAVASGKIHPDARLSDEETAALIFLPGLTTAETVTELAGRGVGMDVVRSEVNAMGGRIETATAAGQGTRLRLVLPLTTAVTQVVMLRCGETVVGVPASLIEIVRRGRIEEVAHAHASGVFAVGEQSLPFFWLGALLQSSGHSNETPARTVPVVIVRSASQRVALHVDEVLGHQEVVVKNLGPQLSRLPGLAGMTLLASGAVGLIYNPVALATVYGRTARELTLQAQAAGAQAATPSAREAAEAEAVVPLVLVVDDSLTVRRVTQRLLVREGYRVALAKDGLEALERLAEERPAVVLSDIEMPRMDGFDLVRNMRADAGLAHLPVIMITSRIAQKHRDYAAELGVDHYLGKPYSEEELLGLIAQYCREQQLV